MLVRLQFIIAIGESTAVAWPREVKGALHGNVLLLTHNPLDSIGYGSEEVALEDSARWLKRFPIITELEITTFTGDRNA